MTPTPPFRQGTLRYRVMVAMAAYGALVMGSTGLFILHDHDTEVAAARTRVTAAVNLLAEHTERNFTAINLVLHHIGRDMDEVPPERIGGGSTWMMVQDAAGLLPLPGIIAVYGADGHAVQVSSAFPPPPGSDAGEQEFFQTARDDPAPLSVGRTIRLGGDGPLFTLTRRRVDEAGGFAGAVTAGIDTAYFTAFNRHLGLGDGAVSGIYRTDGAIIVRFPMADPTGPGIENTGLLAQARTAPAGTVRLVSPVDGGDRLMAYRRIEETSVFVAAGIRMDTVLGPWRTRTAWLIPTALLLLAAGVLAGRALIHALDRQERTMAELDTMRAAAEKAHAAKSRFMAAASHDLRQPIQALRLFLGILEETLDKPAHVQITQNATRALEASERLLSSLLDASRLDAGAVTPAIGPVPLSAVLDPIATQTGPLATEKGLRFLYHPLDVTVCTDPSLLERMVRNLLANALRYTDHGGVMLGCRRRGDAVRIEVWDTGPGIPPAALAAIWDEFYQAGTRTTGEKGLGLGLSIVQRLGALLHHPTGVESREGRGSVFSITVPLAGGSGDGSACQHREPSLHE
ncbi:signal transduction histidine kinase [Azospirillum fermentarium]|uniref:sensor histidine kinase n=1 Tax=Azospirillum fermentarium TaxID=1233114 RepID=UPI0022270BE9|nr:ATP-binding protein [Azospirillum fermentarium]MCW2245962.1 signal transduction histidine kinase [Azospirillum fermentarium]